MTIENQTFTNTNAIPTNMTHIMKLRTMQSVQSESDVVIDWGDGTIQAIKDGVFTSAGGDASNGEADWTCSHTYTSSGKYIIKIYGKDYYCIYQNASNNLMCRAIDHDLPLASHFKNISNFCAGATRLLYLNVDRIKYDFFTNTASLCKSCTNLVKAIGFGRYFQNAFASQMFEECTSMVTCDFQLPYRAYNTTTNNRVFYNCSKLAVDINKLFPDRPTPLFACNSEFRDVFYNCSSLTGTITEKLANLMWNMETVSPGGAKFVNTSTNFVGCSDALRAQVPISWGGTASE